MIANYTISVHYRQFNYRWVPALRSLLKSGGKGRMEAKGLKGKNMLVLQFQLLSSHQGVFLPLSGSHSKLSDSTHSPFRNLTHISFR